MRITKEIISSLRPCRERYDNYLKYYGDKLLTKQQFMGRRHISQSDKLWVAFRLMPLENIRFAAADIAESVFPLFNSEYPGDKKVQEAISLARADLSITSYYDATDASAANAAANAAHATATRAVDYAAASAAASAADAAYVAAASASAANAANTTAVNAAYAVNAAAYATSAAVNAANAANAAYANVAVRAVSMKKVQEKIIRKIVLKYWRKV